MSYSQRTFSWNNLGQQKLPKSCPKTKMRKIAFWRTTSAIGCTLRETLHLAARSRLMWRFTIITSHVPMSIKWNDEPKSCLSKDERQWCRETLWLHVQALQKFTKNTHKQTCFECCSSDGCSIIYTTKFVMLQRSERH